MIKICMVYKGVHTVKLPNTGDAGLDLIYNGKDPEFIFGNTHKILETGIFVEIPPGYFGLVKSRSGMSAKEGIDVFAGVIDSSYRGEIKVVLAKVDQDLENYILIRPGDRIAQMVVIPCLNEYMFVDKLSETERGVKGFGSSGV